LGFGVWGLGLGFGFWVLGFWGLAFGVGGWGLGLGFRVWGKDRRELGLYRFEARLRLLQPLSADSDELLGSSGKIYVSLRMVNKNCYTIGSY